MWPETRLHIPNQFFKPSLLFRSPSLPPTIRHHSSAYSDQADRTTFLIVRATVQHLKMYRYSNVFRSVEMSLSVRMPQESMEVPKDRMVYAAPAPRLFARRPEPVSHLLRLPPELRILIYHHALVAEVTPRMRAHGVSQPPLSTLAQPPLAFVNRKLREECLPVFYANNNFSIAVRQGPACDAGISEDKLAQVLESFYLYWNGFPRESNLRSLRTIQLTWGPSVFIDTISYRLAELTVSFGRPIKSKHATRLQIVRWSMREVEKAVYAAVRQSLRSWPASRRCDLMLGASGLRPIMNIVWLCGNNCPKARRRIDLCTSVEDLTTRAAVPAVVGILTGSGNIIFL